MRDAQRSVELVVLQFESGVIDFNRVFNTQSTLVTLQDQLATTRGNIALNLIQVYKSLGGGWCCFLEGNGLPGTSSLDETPQTPRRNEESVPPAPAAAGHADGTSAP